MGRPSPDTKQILIDTALALIWMSSYGSVSVDDICKAAGVKKGSFYHFFPSKVDLAIAAMDEALRGAQATYDEVFSVSRAPVERFERYAELVYDMQVEVAAKYGRVCGCPCTSLGSEMGGLEEGIRAKFDDITRRKERYFENALRDMVADGLLPEDTDVKARAQEIYAYVVGQLMVARIQNDLKPLKRDLKPGLLQLLGVARTASRAA